METVRHVANTGTTMCSELDKMGLLDASRCCERCHSADDYASLGPCQATLADGRKVFVCCQGRKQLLGEVR
jgi:hypothetical protein